MAGTSSNCRLWLIVMAIIVFSGAPSFGQVPGVEQAPPALQAAEAAGLQDQAALEQPLIVRSDSSVEEVSLQPCSP